MKVSEYIKQYGLKAFEKAYPSEVGVYTATGKAIEQARPLSTWETYEEYREKVEKEKLVAGGIYATTVAAQAGTLRNGNGALKKDTTYKLKTNGLTEISKEMAESLLATGKYRVGAFKPAGVTEYTTISYPSAIAGATGIEGMSWTTLLKWGAVGLLGLLALPSIVGVFRKG